MDIFGVLAHWPGVIQHPYYVMCVKCKQTTIWSFTRLVSDFHKQLYDYGWGYSNVHKNWTCPTCLNSLPKELEK